MKRFFHLPLGEMFIHVQLDALLVGLCQEKASHNNGLAEDSCWPQQSGNNVKRKGPGILVTLPTSYHIPQSLTIHSAVVLAQLLSHQLVTFQWCYQQVMKSSVHKTFSWPFYLPHSITCFFVYCIRTNDIQKILLVQVEWINVSVSRRLLLNMLLVY